MTKSVIASEPAPHRKTYRYALYLVVTERARNHYRTLRRKNYSPTLARHHAAGAQHVLGALEPGDRLFQTERIVGEEIVIDARRADEKRIRRIDAEFRRLDRWSGSR